MLPLLAVIALANPFLAPWDWEKSDPVTLKGAVVTAIQEPAVDSGTIGFWSRIDVRTAAGEPMALFQIHLSRGNPSLPPVGATCDFTYRMDLLGGSAGPGLDASRPWPAVDDFTCQPA